MNVGHDEAAERFRLEVLRLGRRIRREKVAETVSDAQLDVVSRLHDVGPETPGRLAEIEEVSPPAMNRTVNALEKAGYARRTADPTDGRRVIVELTSAGHALVADTRRLRNARMEAELAALAPADRAVLERSAELMKDLLR